MRWYQLPIPKEDLSSKQLPFVGVLVFATLSLPHLPVNHLIIHNYKCIDGCSLGFMSPRTHNLEKCKA